MKHQIKKNTIKFIQDGRTQDLSTLPVNDNETILFILNGIAGSGKSTLANLLHQQLDSVIIANDQIRNEMGYNTKYSKDISVQIREEALKRISQNTDKVVIYDACNTSAKYRRILYSQFRKKFDYIISISVMTPYYKILDNIAERKKITDKDIPVNTVRSMMSSFRIPVINKECDIQLFYLNNDCPSDIAHVDYQNTDRHHQNIHHLESVKTHINSVQEAIDKDDSINMSDKYMLKHIARWHDIGKLFTKHARYGGYSYLSHENASVYLYLTNNLKYYDDITNQHRLDIAYIIANHMNNDILDNIDNNNIVHNIIRDFHKYDKAARLVSPLREQKVQTPDRKTKLRKYNISREYVSPFDLPIKIAKFAIQYHLSIPEVDMILEDSEFFLNRRTSIFDERGNQIAYGLPRFFNINQFENIAQVLLSSLGQDNIQHNMNLINHIVKYYYNKTSGNNFTTENSKMYTKFDGSYVSIFKYKDVIYAQTRGSATMIELSIDKINKTITPKDMFQFLKNKPENIEPYFQNVFNIHYELISNIKDETLIFELIGSLNQIVVKYKDPLLLIHLVTVQNGKYNFVEYDNEFELSLLADGQNLQEGCVLVNDKGNMLKIKNKEYLEHNIFELKDRVLTYLKYEDRRDDILSYSSQYDKKFILAFEHNLDLFFQTNHNILKWVENETMKTIMTVLELKARWYENDVLLRKRYNINRDNFALHVQKQYDTCDKDIHDANKIFKMLFNKTTKELENTVFPLD